MLLNDGCLDGECGFGGIAGPFREAAGRVATVLGKDFKPYMCLVVGWICPKMLYNDRRCIARELDISWGYIH